MSPEYLKLIQTSEEPGQVAVLDGEIVFNGGASSLDCQVRNFSDLGCRLVPPPPNNSHAWLMLAQTNQARRIRVQAKRVNHNPESALALTRESAWRWAKASASARKPPHSKPNTRPKGS